MYAPTTAFKIEEKNSDAGYRVVRPRAWKAPSPLSFSRRKAHCRVFIRGKCRGHRTRLGLGHAGLGILCIDEKEQHSPP